MTPGMHCGYRHSIYNPRQVLHRGRGSWKKILTRPTPLAQQRVCNYPQSACVLTSEHCIRGLEEKAEEKKRKQEEEEKMKERETTSGKGHAEGGNEED